MVRGEAGATSPEGTNGLQYHLHSILTFAKTHFVNAASTIETNVYLFHYNVVPVQCTKGAET